MSSIAHHRYRLWMMFLATLNLVMMIADYSFLAALVAKANDPYDSMTPGDTHTLLLFWNDYVLIVATVLIFFSYYYTLRGKRHTNRFARGVYVLALAVLLIIVAAKYIDEQIKFASIFIATGSSLIYKPFTCVGAETTSCNLILANIFIALFTGVFSLFEVLWTFSFKPLEAKQEYH
ncbi:hypothetical protein BG015_008829 [Linnemannia schmuckeri]|uniref:Uncharacterized protein n=1 Tax=Linnemannia schmuckeri TaxID=64567 RepID=A0A9P5V9U6_9FUNG|nr:hypothetical protein BG015_008829 [Linnemannia schmuckeri]